MQINKIINVIVKIVCFFSAFMFFIVGIVFFAEADYLSCFFMIVASIICAVPTDLYPFKSLPRNNKIILKVTISNSPFYSCSGFFRKYG